MWDLGPILWHVLAYACWEEWSLGMTPAPWLCDTLPHLLFHREASGGEDWISCYNHKVLCSSSKNLANIEIPTAWLTIHIIQLMGAPTRWISTARASIHLHTVEQRIFALIKVMKFLVPALFFNTRICCPGKQTESPFSVSWGMTMAVFIHYIITWRMAFLREKTLMCYLNV